MTSFNFYRKSVTTVGGMALALFLNSQALAATTFTGALTDGGLSATYSITTNDTIGVLSSSDITSWTVLISDGVISDSFSNVGGFLVLSGSSLSATPTDLLFDYGVSGVNYLLFGSPSAGSILDFETNDALNADRTAVRLNFSPFVGSTQTGVQSIASIPRDPGGAVPEPGTWAMMLLGFGAIGVGMRRRTLLKRTLETA